MVFGLTRSGLEPTTYITRSERSNHYSPDTVYFFIFYFNLLRYNCKHIYYILERRVWRCQISKSKKDRQHNGAKNKRTNNDLQNNTQKTKCRVTRHRTPPPPHPHQLKKHKKQKQKIKHKDNRGWNPYCNQSIT